MPYLDVPVRTAADIPAPGQYNVKEAGKSKAARWGDANTPGTLEEVIMRARLVPGPGILNCLPDFMFNYYLNYIMIVLLAR